MIFSPERLREFCPESLLGIVAAIAPTLEVHAPTAWVNRQLSLIARKIALAWSSIWQATHRSGDRFNQIVSTNGAHVDDGWRYFVAAASGRNAWVSHAVNRDGVDVAAVFSALLLNCRPAAISRLVVALMVQSVDRMFGGWTRAHIVQKGYERFIPVGANFDPARSVILEVFVPRIVTPALDAKPRPVFRANCSAPLMSVLGNRSSWHVICIEENH
jgi:hypothetical protein